jgi:hypothetical protein
MGFLGDNLGATIGTVGGSLLGGPTGALIGASIGGGIDSNRMNIASSREQMAFQERMAKTSYQNAVADMKSAGLNPALAYQQGGASTPTGSKAVVDNVFKDAMQFVSLEQGRQNINTAKAQERFINAQAKRISTLTPLEAKNILTNIEYGSPIKTFGDVWEKSKQGITNTSKDIDNLRFRYDIKKIKPNYNKKDIQKWRWYK